MFVEYRMLSDLERVPKDCGGLYFFRLRFPTDFELGIDWSVAEPRDVKRVLSISKEYFRMSAELATPLELEGVLSEVFKAPHLQSRYKVLANRYSHTESIGLLEEAMFVAADSDEKLRAVLSAIRIFFSQLPIAYVGMSSRQSLYDRLLQHVNDTTGFSERIRQRGLGWNDFLYFAMRLADAVNQRLVHLNEVIAEFVTLKKSSDAIKKVKTIFSDLVTRPVELKDVKILQDLASKDCIQLENWIGEALTHIQAQTKVIHLQLNKLDEELSNVSLQIERAPDQESLKSDLEAIKSKNEEIVQLSTERNTHLELARRYTWQAIDLVRKMRKLEEQLVSSESKGTGTDLAKNTRDVLTAFAEEMTKRKIVKLEKEFTKTFTRLARKTDTVVSANIDPITFEVHLYNRSGKGISKQDLSAGEKQIYAVAMLEALAKTSGRKLPIIIDTPLGRLDSHHREKLINNYFPQASHQVIILSTDTEVDKSFYDDLNKHISHCYHISYDEAEGASEIKEGYFWKAALDKEGVLAYAA